MRLIQFVFHLIISLHNYKLLPTIYKQGLHTFAYFIPYAVYIVLWPLKNTVLKCFKEMIFGLPERSPSY